MNDTNYMAKFYQQAWEMTKAYVMIDRADKLKYGTLVKGLYLQNSLGSNQYPRDLKRAIDILGLISLIKNTMKH